MLAHADRSKEWHRKHVLSTMPVVRRSLHTVVSQWGSGEAGLLKLTKQRALHGMGSYHSIPAATHADFASRWVVMYIRLLIMSESRYTASTTAVIVHSGISSTVQKPC